MTTRPAAPQVNPRFVGIGSDAGVQVVRRPVLTVATAGVHTYVASDLRSTILRDPAGSAREDVLPAAAAIIAAFQLGVGEYFDVFLSNAADQAEAITFTGGTGTTITTPTVAQNETVQLRFLCTADDAVVVRSVKLA